MKPRCVQALKINKPLSTNPLIVLWCITKLQKHCFSNLKASKHQSFISIAYQLLAYDLMEMKTADTQG